MTVPLFLAIGFSLVAILVLFRQDPKRRRAANLSGAGHSRSTRHLLAAAVLIPGVLLAVFGESAGFLVWLGSCALAGWLLTLSSGLQRPR